MGSFFFQNIRFTLHDDEEVFQHLACVRYGCIASSDSETRSAKEAQLRFGNQPFSIGGLCSARLLPWKRLHVIFGEGRCIPKS